VTNGLFDPLVACSRFSRPAPAASVHVDSVISRCSRCFSYLTLHAFHLPRIRATSHARLILLYLITLTIIGRVQITKPRHLLAPSFTQFSVGLFPRSAPNTVSDICRKLWTEGGPHTSRTGPCRGAAAACLTVTVQSEPRTGRSESWFIHWFVYLTTALTNQNSIRVDYIQNIPASIRSRIF